VRAIIATRSPNPIPDAIRPLAVARISASNSRALTGCQPSPSGRETKIRSGSNQALSATKLVRFPWVAFGSRAGMKYSLMGAKLAVTGR